MCTLQQAQSPHVRNRNIVTLALIAQGQAPSISTVFTHPFPLDRSQCAFLIFIEPDDISSS